MKVKFIYFKPSGKFYSEDEAEVEADTWWAAVGEARRMRNTHQLPGLTSGQWDDPMLIYVGDDDLPHLLL